MKVVWLIQNLVPYHHARFEAFARLDGVNAYLIQVTEKDPFSVLEFQPKETSYKLLTLFTHVDRKSVGKYSLQKYLSKTLLKIGPDCICVSGWGMVIGQIMQLWALENNVPFVIVRGISDLADERAHKQFEDTFHLTIERPAQVVLEMLRMMSADSRT